MRCILTARRTLAVLVVCALLPLSGCGAALKREAQTLDSIVWPPPPQEPRVAWVRSISTSSDARIEKGFLSRVRDLLFGEEIVKIARPYGVYADGENRIFIADPGARSVHVIDPRGGRYLVVAGGPEHPFASPIGVTQDADETVYVTDSSKAAIYRFRLSDLKVEPFVTRGLLRPTGIAYSPVRRLIYVSDTLAGQVVAFDAAGKEVLRFGAPGEGTGTFNRPTDLTVGADGSIAVTDSLNGRLQVFSGGGAYLRGFGERGDVSGTFAKPKGIAVDSKGRLHVCDTLFDTVQVFNQKGELLLSYGSRGSGNGELWMPSGLYIDAHDTIYVADTYNNRVQVFQLLPDQSQE